MPLVRILRQALPAILGAAVIALASPAIAAVKVDANGASVEGPEAPPSARNEPAASMLDHGTIVMTTRQRETNLRKSRTFVAVLGSASFK